MTVFSPASNGGRPVVVLLSSRLDPRRSVRLLTYFHGHEGNLAGMVGGTFRLRLLDLLDADPQLVVVVPQATASPFGYWMSPPESFAALSRESLIVATLMVGVPQLAVDEEIVDAHSGGGLALKNAALTGELRADKVNLLDAAYGDWAQVVATWALANGARVESWFTRHATQLPSNQEIVFLDPARIRAHEVTISHSEVPSCALGTR